MPRRHPETSTVEHLVIVGNGMAGHRLVEALLARTERPAKISVIGAEQAPAYNRILLSPLLAGEMERDALTLHSAEWYAEQGIELALGERVEAINRDARTLTTDAGRRLDYDRLVLATGSNPARPPVPGLELPGVHVFRDLHDADALARAAESGRNAVVIGGGLLGLEAAEGLRKRGMQVSLLQRDDRLMNRQLDLTAAHLLENELRSRGLDIHTDAQLERLEADAEGQVCAALLADGTRLAADCVVVAIGIVPNAELGRVAGLEVNRGVIVDEWLTTSDPAIHALGECCEHRGNLYGLVEPIWRQVEVLAERLCLDHDHADAEPAQGYVEKPTATKLKVSGISLYAFGPTDAEPDHEVLSYRDPQQGDYRRLLLRDGRLEGAVLYGDTAFGPWYFEQALAGADLTACRAALLLGATDAQALLDDASNESPHSPAKEAA
ncbi:NAD(P)/FAD-dependent oxidoreductase [Halomonas sp. MCCC 1A11036]|uniref:NAD(P)/FAD-dependent oxidoreductase n=1 Tax=Billgrantia zhangzhouensis TaxID=2733481 RepID=A0ABS9ABM9_9GAMM|nr:FAD-dependent oxidoreductase [Halomonas zhangzhouensis]MCE8019322.1 NAD(P)/FAD-dependent oxidoreductase [Halomonas zhangzhouensis]